jgi:hypothetical protein
MRTVRFLGESVRQGKGGVGVGVGDVHDTADQGGDSADECPHGDRLESSVAFSSLHVAEGVETWQSVRGGLNVLRLLVGLRVRGFKNSTVSQICGS